MISLACLPIRLARFTFLSRHSPVDVLLKIRTKLSMISQSGKGDEHVEERHSEA